MTEQKCPSCGADLKAGLEEPCERFGIEDYSAPRYDCASCGWSSVQDLPGTRGGDNGGANDDAPGIRSAGGGGAFK